MASSFRIAAIAALAGLPIASAAAPAVYISAFGGVNFQEDQDSADVVDSELSRLVSLDFDPGFVVGGSVGYAFPEALFGRFRVELEGAYRKNDIDDGVTLGTEPVFGGDQSAITGLAMLYYDVTEFSETATPYIGAGVGAAGIDSDVTYAPLSSNSDMPRVAFGGDTTTEFAWQVVAGFSIPLVPSIDLTVDGRYFATTDPDFDREIIDTGARTGTFDSEFESWMITGGFRFTF